MKILIWFLCFFANAIINVILGSIGVRLGAIPTAFLTFATFSSAFFLCKKWDEHKQNKKTENDNSLADSQDSRTNQTEYLEPGQKRDNTQAEATSFKKFTVRIYDTVNHTIRNEERTIDINKFPTEKYAEDGMYYAIEKMNNDHKVRVYCSKDNWQSQVDNQPVEKSKIRFCRKCGFELIEDSEFCSQCGTKIINNTEMK